VGGADGLVGGEHPHAPDAVALLVPLLERHVVGLLHHELRLVQLDTDEAGSQVARRTGVGRAGAGQRHRIDRRRHQQQQQRARGRRRSCHVSLSIISHQ